MTNQLQICNWLVNRSGLLELANQMLDAKKKTLSSSTVLTASSTPCNDVRYGKFFDWLKVRNDIV